MSPRPRALPVGGRSREYEYLDRAEAISYRNNQITDLELIGDVGCKGIGRAAFAADRVGDLERVPVTVKSVDGHGRAHLAPAVGRSSCPARASCRSRARPAAAPEPCDHHLSQRRPTPSFATAPVENGWASGRAVTNGRSLPLWPEPLWASARAFGSPLRPCPVRRFGVTFTLRHSVTWAVRSGAYRLSVAPQLRVCAARSRRRRGAGGRPAPGSPGARANRRSRPRFPTARS